jgi:uncharacterized damage-inducible protein DinB
MDASAFEEFYTHMQWADAKVWAAGLEAPDGATDERLRDTLLHLHHVQRGFLGLWCATLESPLAETLDSDVDPHDLGSATELRDWARAYYPMVEKFLGSLDSNDLDRAIEIPWAAVLEKRLGRPPDPVTLRETLHQVVLHSMHHRGQVNRRIRELGGEPPLVDYIAWLWIGRPAPAW